MAKKILTAFTEQVIQFDNEAEYADYIVSLKKGKQQFSVSKTVRKTHPAKCS